MRERAGSILLVGEDEEDGFTYFFRSEHLMENLTVLPHTFNITGVDDKDEALHIFIVMLYLIRPLKDSSTNVPHIEANVLVRDGLDVEADCWNLVHDLTELELVENSGLADSIETNHSDFHLLRTKHQTLLK